MPPANSEATPSRCRRSPSFSRRWISTRCGAELGARAQAAQRLRDLLAGADEHLGELDRLLHRRLHAVEPELRRDLLGVVDDVVERGRQRVAVAGVERRAHAPPAGQPVDDVVRDAVAFLLADLQVLGERAALGVVDAAGRAAAARSAARCARPPRRGAISAASGCDGRKLIRARILRRRKPPACSFTVFSRFDHEFATTVRGVRCEAVRSWRPFPTAREHGPVRGRARDQARRRARARQRARADAVGAGVRAAGGDGAASSARSSPATSCTTTVWGGELRPGDRSVDVYVSKLRSKLEAALPDRRFIHTHPGFGYRFQPEPSQFANAPGGAAPARRGASAG